MEKFKSDRQLGLQFTEKMKGFFVRDPTVDFSSIEARNPEGANPFEFTLTIRTEDLSDMLQNPNHEARIGGVVNSPSLCQDPMTVSRGTFNLFVSDPKEVETQNMRYRFTMSDSPGHQYFLNGTKIIRDQSMLHLWHDTTTLYITLYEGPDGTGPTIGRGVLHIEPADFLRQLTTMRVTNAADAREELSALAAFGSFFAGTLYRHYGGVLSGLYAFDSKAPPREKRLLSTCAPEIHCFETEDGVNLQLTRYRGGRKGPVILAHGLGVSSLIFSTDTVNPNLLEFLYAAGYDVWLLDFRVSIHLPAVKLQSGGDEIARYDYPAAVAKVRQVAQAETVQFVVHCWGATTFFMAMLAGLQDVRSFVSSQVGTYFISPPDVNLKTGLHVPEIFDSLGIKQLDATVTSDEKWWEKVYDQALKLPAMIFAQGRCNSATCHRITFMYASLYNHAQLDDVVHDNLHEMFGVANMRSFEHIATIGRAGKIVDFRAGDTYLPHLDRLDLPICFIHGYQNHCFLPESTQKTYDLLCSRFNPRQYARHVIPGYGHIDCILGKNAARDVYPFILQHLEKFN